MYRLFFLFFTFSFFQLTAQDENLRYEDYTYLENIRSVKFHPIGSPIDAPIIGLNEPNNLVLYFDDLDDEIKDYAYEIVHCTKDWQPSGLNDMEYLDGFTGNIIEDIYNSFGTRVNYTHYRLYLPNEDIRWTLSGNYLLKIYEDEDEKRLAITRRFMVFDRKVVISANQTGTAKVEKLKTHQEVDFTVVDKKSVVRSPRQELSAVVLQNFRADNAIYNLEPLFIKQEKIIFDYQDKIVFPAGNEFRFFDTRNLRFQGQGIRNIRVYDDGFEVDLITGRKRINSPYLTYLDANGQFVIEEGTQNRTFGTLRDSTDLTSFDLISIQDQNDLREMHLRADYADVLFSLESIGEIPDAKVYVFGGLTDWQLKPEFEMRYSEAASAYYLNAFLKQGYYNYQYVIVEDGVPDISLTEGNFLKRGISILF
ncbi:MAG: DUF5103 domain-containing protein [Saprospiraceae bacterium]